MERDHAGDLFPYADKNSHVRIQNKNMNMQNKLLELKR
jgi:hypothetical protein